MKSKNHLKREKNILYTGFGDKGTTTLFNCKQGRVSKSALIIEALGAVDELNAYLGIVKVYAEKEQLKIKIGNKNISYSLLVDEIQQVLFIIQAELAGSELTVLKKSLNRIEKIINTIGDILPPIKSFTVSGGSLLSAKLDYGRTLARRVERRIISVGEEEGSKKIGLVTLSYLNRLSSVLFAMSRYANFILDISEEHPRYNKK
ncbi:MAG: cob(I)yrinic acid a,c-diamide adenosyltransferase [Candidatus Pacebacteria bacterium]|nr:cob(I)yrinic acid a,c-diamide adenosyltransferase [Candidatus Paceibacterota bacterium]